MNRRHLLGLLAVSPLASPAILRAQENWPQRPIRMLLAYAPGGGTDNVARVLAARLQAVLGQPVVVENKPGAGGNLATEAVASAKPDGYTLLMGNQGPMTVNQSLFPNMRVDPLVALDPVGLVADAPLVAVAGPSTKARTLAAFLDEARKQNGQMSYASASNGSASHLAAALMFQMAGVEAQHLPFRGAGPALNDIVAGHIPFMVTTLPSVAGLIQGELVQPLAVTGNARITALPNVPTVAEAALPDITPPPGTASWRPRARLCPSAPSWKQRSQIVSTRRMWRSDCRKRAPCRRVWVARPSAPSWAMSVCDGPSGERRQDCGGLSTRGSKLPFILS
jgi:tripartite-type tricarboxylate transporter receptor subunit TctC